jgi:hypothetical protein
MSGSTSIRALIGEGVDTFLCTLSESARKAYGEGYVAGDVRENLIRVT